MSVIIDVSTGTMLSAETCRIVPDDAFTDAEWDGMDDRSDSEIAAFGRERGRPFLADSYSMDIIARTLSGSEWNADMIDAIADLIRATGRTIEDIQ